jgi:hypothetical protein
MQNAAKPCSSKLYYLPFVLTNLRTALITIALNLISAALHDGERNRDEF